MTVWSVRIATLCLVSACFGLLAPPLAAIATRFELVSYKLGVPLAGLGLLVACVTVLLSLVLLLLPPMTPARRKLAFALVLSLPCAVLGIQLVLKGGSVPVIHDISTSLDDPPVFTAAALQRNAGHNPLTIEAEVLAQQRTAYPELDALRVTNAPSAVFETAVSLARTKDWMIYRSDPDKLEFEAVVTTLWFGFQDDVMVRLSSEGGRTRVDMRSASRVGRSDLGANAARIQDFLAELNGLLN